MKALQAFSVVQISQLCGAVLILWFPFSDSCMPDPVGNDLAHAGVFFLRVSLQAFGCILGDVDVNPFLHGASRLTSFLRVCILYTR